MCKKSFSFCFRFLILSITKIVDKSIKQKKISLEEGKVKKLHKRIERERCYLIVKELNLKTLLKLPTLNFLHHFFLKNQVLHSPVITPT